MSDQHYSDLNKLLCDQVCIWCQIFGCWNSVIPSLGHHMLPTLKPYVGGGGGGGDKSVRQDRIKYNSVHHNPADYYKKMTSETLNS